jgi:hypothetical protein
LPPGESVAAGDAGEEPDLGLPRAPRRIAGQARDPREALEAVQAVAVERDEEVERHRPGVPRGRARRCHPGAKL